MARHQARQLIEWYVAMGVDIGLSETPVDRFAETAAAKAAPPHPSRSERAPNDAPAFDSEQRGAIPDAPRPSFEPARAGVVGRAGEPAEATVMAARAEAAAATSLDDLKERMARFDGCALRFTAKQLVFADGNPQGRLMLVGEAPGREEDLSGLPFVGRAGKLLDRMLAAVGLTRADVYIANVVPWRPPGNRNPTANETEIMRPFLERQIELCGPEMLVTLGNPAMQTLLGGTGILSRRGKWTTYRLGDQEIPAMPMLHPASLLRNPAQKRLSWRDFREVARRLGETAR